MTVFLVGGGPRTLPPGLLDPFLAEVRAAARRPTVAVVVVDVRRSGRRFLPDYLQALGPGIDVQPVFLRRRGPAAAGAVDGVDGIVVGGGPTPAYLDGLAGVAGPVARRVSSGTPYLGFSAGAMVAPHTALVGGRRLTGRDVCPEEWSEELDDVTVRAGLGLVGFPVDVHTAQAGTLGRTVALVGSGAAPVAVGIDEDTCLAVVAAGADPADGVVTGRGSVWEVRRAASSGAVDVTRRTAR